MKFKILTVAIALGLTPFNVAYMDSPKELIPGVLLHDTSNQQYDDSLGAELIEQLKERNRVEYTYTTQKSSPYEEVSNNYRIFDESYNDRDENAINQIGKFKVHNMRGDAPYETKKRVIRIVSPYMKASYIIKNELTNDVRAKDYKSREELNEANHKEARKYLDELKRKKEKKTSPKMYELKSKDEIRKTVEDFVKPLQMLEFPLNDPADYKLLADTPGFPKTIPSFANKVYMHGHPQFLQGGGFVQLSFGGTKEELAPYIAEAKNNAKIIVDAQDISKLFVKSYVDSDMEYADSLDKLLPYSIVTVENTTVQMGRFVEEQKRRPIEKIVDEMYEKEKKVVAEFNRTKSDNESEDDKVKRYIKLLIEFDKTNENKTSTEPLLINKGPIEVYAEDKNRQLQKSYLGRLSYNERNVEIPSNYTFYIFDFGGNWNHPYSLGAIVSPNEDYIIYFLQNG